MKRAHSDLSWEIQGGPRHSPSLPASPPDAVLASSASLGYVYDTFELL